MLQQCKIMHIFKCNVETKQIVLTFFVETRDNHMSDPLVFAAL